MEYKFYNLALRFLSYRPRSEKEVRDRLNIKYQSFDKAQDRKSNIKNLTLVIDKVIQKLKEQKFINDEEFAKWWIESRLRFRPRSINLIKKELLQKGIERDIIDGQISNLIHSTGSGQISNDLQQAKKLIEKRIERFRNLTKQEIYQKLGRYLASKGFDWETIKQSIDEVILKGV